MKQSSPTTEVTKKSSFVQKNKFTHHCPRARFMDPPGNFKRLTQEGDPVGEHVPVEHSRLQGDLERRAARVLTDLTRAGLKGKGVNAYYIVEFTNLDEEFAETIIQPCKLKKTH